MGAGDVEAGMQYDAVAVAAALGLALDLPAAEPAVPTGRGPGFAEGAVPLADGGGARPSFGLMQRLVERGLPRRALRHLALEVAGDPERAAALEHWIVPRTTLARRGEEGLLTPEESEKTERLARLYVQAATGGLDLNAVDHPDAERIAVGEEHPVAWDRRLFGGG